jgi:hypothetical protein
MKGLGVNRESQEIYQGLVDLIENNEEAKNLIKEALQTSFQDYKKNPDSEVINKLCNMLMGQFAVSMLRSMFPNTK